MIWLRLFGAHQCRGYFPQTKMNEKHVRIEPSSGFTTENVRDEHDESTMSNKEADIPRHLLPPSHDGYRTPTIEDFELQMSRLRGSQRSASSLNNNGSHSRLPYLHPTFLPRHSANPSSTSLALSILEKLQWKERIRHFTWTFFTTTMAVSFASIHDFLFHQLWHATQQIPRH